MAGPGFLLLFVGAARLPTWILAIVDHDARGIVIYPEHDASIRILMTAGRTKSKDFAGLETRLASALRAGRALSM